MRRVTDFEFDTFGIFEGQAVVTEVEAGSCGVEIVRFHVMLESVGLWDVVGVWDVCLLYWGIMVCSGCWVLHWRIAIVSRDREESFGNREQGGVESLPVSLDRRVYMYMYEYLAIIR